MSLPEETLLELMALADGELSGDDRERVERLVAGSDEARRVVASLRSPALGDWLGEEIGGRLGPADGIADAVMARLDGVAGAGGGSGTVARLGEARARRASRAPLVAGMTAAALALAAGVALYLQADRSAPEDRAPIASVGVPSVDLRLPPAPPSALAERPSQGVEVDEVDSPARGVSVFEIQVGGGPAAAAHAAGPSSVVIMIEDDPGTK